jgi:tetratricopeptide (TPR) repeat protein
MMFTVMEEIGTKKFLPLAITVVILAVAGYLAYQISNQSKEPAPMAANPGQLPVSVSLVSVDSLPGGAGTAKAAISKSADTSGAVQPKKPPNFDYRPPADVLAKKFPDQKNRQSFLEAFDKNINDLKTDPKNISAWISLGGKRESIDDYAGASEVWRYAAWLAPNNMVPFWNLADLNQNYIRDYNAAAGYYQSVIKIMPSYTLAYVNFSQMLAAENKNSEAKKVLLQGIENNPGSLVLMLALGDIYRDQGDKADAAAYYSQAAALATKLGNSSLADLLKQRIEGLGGN